MPPTRKFQKEDIIEAGLKLTEERGFDSLNTRILANMLGCSVQPLFHNFTNMEELKQSVFEKIYDVYREYMCVDVNKENSYKEQGLGYIKFAIEHPEFFKAIFMKSSDLNVTDFVMHDDKLDDIIRSGQKLTGFSYEKQKEFHIKVWIFTHGIACLVAMRTIVMDEAEIAKLLESTVREMMIGFKEKEDKK